LRTAANKWNGFYQALGVGVVAG